MKFVLYFRLILLIVLIIVLLSLVSQIIYNKISPYSREYSSYSPYNEGMINMDVGPDGNIKNPVNM